MSYGICNAGVEGRIAGSSPAATPAYPVSTGSGREWQMRQRRWPARRDIVSQPHGAVVLPALGIDEVVAQALDVGEGVERGLVVEQLLGEDQLVGGVADALLLFRQQLGRANVAERLNHLAVGKYTIRIHNAANGARRSAPRTWLDGQTFG
jgi:hypothetical protein